MSTELHWSFAGGWFWTGMLTLALLLGISLWNLHQRGWHAKQVVLEALRLLLALAIFLALAKPETWVSDTPKEPTQFLALSDLSASMETEDMDLPLPEEGKVTRRAWLDSRMAWKDALGPDVALISQDFESSESGQTNLHAALMDAMASHDALGGIILFSDGDWNAGPSPDETALALRRRGLPVFAIAVGQETALPDVALRWLPMPKTLVIDEPTRLPFQVTNRFPDEIEVAIQFSHEGSNPAEDDLPPKTIRLSAYESREDHFVWTPRQEGEPTLRIETPVLPGENREDNNAAETMVSVRRDRLQVLLVDSTPRWEFRYLRNALMRDPGVEVACVLFHPHPEMGMGKGPGYLETFPENLEALTSYDVVFLGDVGLGERGLSEPQAENLRGLVERQASGLVFLPGRLGQQHSLESSPLDELIPVTMDPQARVKGVQSASPAAMELTKLGRESILTLLGSSTDENAAVWRSLPGFYWHAPIFRAKAGASVLAVHESSLNRYGRLPLLVTRPFGSGKVLYLGTDGAWRWRRGVEDLYHYRFWSQVARWMAYQRNLAENDQGRIIHYPEAPEAGNEITIHATLLGKDRGPLVNAQARLNWIRDGAGNPAPQHAKRGTIPLSEIESGWGVYNGSWQPESGGAYQVTVTLENDPSFSLQTTIHVATPVQEATGEPARPDVLRRLAAATDGEFLSADQWSRLPELLQPLSKSRIKVTRHEWWRHPGFLSLLIVGFGVYWIARKRIGLV